MTDGKPVRERVLDYLLDVMEKGTLSHLALAQVRKAVPEMNAQDRSFFTRLAEGTLERCLTLDYVLNQYSRTPVKKMKPVIRNVLRMSVYQILYMDSVPDSAACNEAVKLVKKRGLSGLSGFVNGLLRRISREKETIPWPDPENRTEFLSVRYSMPAWLVEDWSRDRDPETAEQMLAAFLAERPVTVRLNESRIPGESRDEKRLRAVASLAGQGILSEPGHYLPQALLLTNPDHLENLEAMKNGWLTVQDESSMLSVLAGYLAWKERHAGEPEQIRDVCAAPGGKSLFLADLTGDRAGILDCDVSEAKCRMIRENRDRCGFSGIRTQVWDARVPDTNWMDKADILIADLPCSGLGIMGKKNDIRYKATAEGCRELAALQKQILDTVCRYVKPGGILVYSTCTIRPEENEENRDYIRSRGDFVPVPLTACLRPGLAQTGEAEELLKEKSLGEGWLQLLPGRHACDGFFFSVFEKRRAEGVLDG